MEVKESARGKDWTSVTFKSLGGGVFELYLFYGPGYLDVIKQY
jgi:hypothetical protein